MYLSLYRNDEELWIIQFFELFEFLNIITDSSVTKASKINLRYRLKYINQSWKKIAVSIWIIQNWKIKCISILNN